MTKEVTVIGFKSLKSDSRIATDNCVFGPLLYYKGEKANRNILLMAMGADSGFKAKGIKQIPSAINLTWEYIKCQN